MESVGASTGPGPVVRVLVTSLDVASFAGIVTTGSFPAGPEIVTAELALLDVAVEVELPHPATATVTAIGARSATATRRKRILGVGKVGGLSLPAAPGRGVRCPLG